MAKYICNITLVALLIFTGCDEFNLEDPFIYPTGIDKLSMEELLELNEAFQEKNPNICSTLNEYGLTGFSTVLFEGRASPCLDRETVRVELTRPDTLLDLARKTLVENQDYTGISSAGQLELKEMEPLKGCIVCEGPNIDSRDIEWKFVFAGQKINGIVVYGSTITVVADGNGINRIWGNWYDSPYIPARPNYRAEEIVETISGQTIVWEEADATWHHTIEADSLQLPDSKSIIPFENEDEGRLELRSGWEIRVPAQDVPFGGWIVIGDMIDGRILKVDKIIKDSLIDF